MSTMTDFITGETIAATVMMIRNTQSALKPVVLVEGDKDRRILKNVLGHHAEVVPGHGKAETLDTLNYLDLIAASKWLIIIVDADFDRILNKKYNEMVLLTDVHDMDCEHIRSPAFVKVVQELCSEQKCQRAFSIKLTDNPEALAGEIRTLLLSMAAQIGALRLVSIQNNFMLAFKRVEHAKVLEKSRFAINLVSLINVVLAAGGKPGLTPVTLRVELEKVTALQYDPWQICQGHDITRLFVLAVRKYWGIGRLTIDEVERSLRLAYEAEHFWQSNLGKEVVARFRAMGYQI